MTKMYIPPRDTSPDKDGAGTALSGTLPLAPPPPPPQTRGTHSYSAPTPLKTLPRKEEGMMIGLPPRDTSPHQDSAGTALSGTPPPAQPPPPLQTRGTHSYSAPTPLKTLPGEEEGMIICVHPRDTSPHQDSAVTALSGTPPLAQPPRPPQRNETQPHSAPPLLNLTKRDRNSRARAGVRRPK